MSSMRPAAAAAGLGKEGLDLAGYGTPDVADLAFDAMGIGVGVAFALVVEALHHQQANLVALPD